MNNLTLVPNDQFTVIGEMNFGGCATFIGKELNGDRVMFFDDLLAVTGMDKEVLKKTIQRCETLCVNTDYFKVGGERLKKLKEINNIHQGTNCPLVIAPRASHLVVFTRQGVGQIMQKVQFGNFVWESLKSNYFDVPQEPAFKVPETFAEALFLAGKLEAERVQLALENKEKEALLVKQEAEHEMFVDNFFDESSTISIGTFAKITGVLGQKRMFAYLRDSGVMMASRNEPYQKYMHHFVIRGQFSTPLLKCTSAKWLLTRMAKDNLISTSKKDMCYDNIKAKYSDDLDVALEAAFKAA